MVQDRNRMKLCGTHSEKCLWLEAQSFGLFDSSLRMNLSEKSM